MISIYKVNKIWTANDAWLWNQRSDDINLRYLIRAVAAALLSE